LGRSVAVGFPDDDDLQRHLRDMQRAQEQLRRVTQGFRMPQESVRQMVESLRVPQESIRDITESMRVPQRQWRDLVEASRLPQQQWRDMVEAVRIPPQQWRAMIEATRIPQQQWRDLLAAPRVPVEDWNRLFASLRSSVTPGGATIDWDAVVEEAATTVREAEASQGEGKASWLLRLTIVDQLALLVAFLQVLDALGTFMADLAGGDDLPPEVRSGMQVLFATVAVLLMVIQLRRKSGDD
jgi:hypothetical protein